MDGRVYAQYVCALLVSLLNNCSFSYASFIILTFYFMERGNISLQASMFNSTYVPVDDVPPFCLRSQKPGAISTALLGQRSDAN